MMSKAPRVPPVVAELGRPESAEETAGRQAQNSRNHRARFTINNLALSLIATLGAVIAIVLLVPRAEEPVVKTIDFASVAANAQSSFADSLAVPVLPDGWHANSATTRGEGGDGIRSWYIGFITPKKQFIGLTQGFGADQRWLAAQLADSSPTATIMVDGVAWTAYDNRAVERDVGNVKYALVTEEGDSTYVLFGTADTGEFQTLGSALTKYLDHRVEDPR